MQRLPHNTALRCLALLLAWGLSGPGHTANQGGDEALATTRIAIIIDDIGYHPGHGRQAAELPGAVTLAILPHSPHGARLAQRGHRQGKEIILHIPMSALSGRPLDPGGLTESMGYSEFMRTLTRGVAAIPHVTGVNNHMGSKLTQQAEPMGWLMDTLKAWDLYFVDSRTSADSVAWELAQRARVPSVERDFFLDNEPDYVPIANQFGKFLAMARRTGQGVAIAHPHPETLRFLAEALPMLEAADIELVPVSALLKGPETEASAPQVVQQQSTVSHMNRATEE